MMQPESDRRLSPYFWLMLALFLLLALGLVTLAVGLLQGPPPPFLSISA